jgi:hypothetical protein
VCGLSKTRERALNEDDDDDEGGSIFAVPHNSFKARVVVATSSSMPQKTTKEINDSCLKRIMGNRKNTSAFIIIIVFI